MAVVYGQATRKHKVLFWGLMLSTVLFSGLLTYGNTYVMSLIVDRVSAAQKLGRDIIVILIENGTFAAVYKRFGIESVS